MPAPANQWNYKNIEFKVKTPFISPTPDNKKVCKFSKLWTRVKKDGSGDITLKYQVDGKQVVTSDTIDHTNEYTYTDSWIWGTAAQGGSGLLWGESNQFNEVETGLSYVRNRGKTIAFEFSKSNDGPPIVIYDFGFDWKHKSGRR